MNILPLILAAGVIHSQVAAVGSTQIPSCMEQPSATLPSEKLFSESQDHMGTQFTIQVYAPPLSDPQPAIKAAFERIASLDDMLSDYDPQSELSRLSATSPHLDGVTVSQELWDILQQGGEVSRATGGSFDVTVGPLTRLWRQARRQKRIPDSQRLDAALAAVGHQHIEFAKEQRLRLTKPGMRLDLGGIAQGYAADEALAVMRKQGFSRVLVNASGDLRAGDAPPGKDGWKVGLSSIVPMQAPTSFIYLKNGAVSTSGDAFQFVIVDGKRYSHIVDPATGIGLTTPMSVTVYAPNCTLADALASAFAVLGPEKAKATKYVRSGEVHARFILRKGEAIETVETPGWESLDVRSE